jgi:hypothetical protein
LLHTEFCQGQADGIVCFYSTSTRAIHRSLRCSELLPLLYSNVAKQVVAVTLVRPKLFAVDARNGAAVETDIFEWLVVLKALHPLD